MKPNRKHTLEFHSLLHHGRIYFAALFLIITRFKLLYTDWRGYLVALFALVWVANQYMSIYNRLRLDIKHEQVEIQAKQEDVNLGRNNVSGKAA